MQLDEAEAEHAEAKQLIAQIRTSASASEMEAMDDLVARLASAIDHHVKVERGELFSKACARTGLDLDASADELRERQQTAEGEV